MVQCISLDDIISVEEIHIERVHDIEVQDNHNYLLAANGGIIVHNSSKTWDTYHLIYAFCDHNRDKGNDIYILRDTLTNCREKTFKDFKKCMKVIGADLTYTAAGQKPYVNIFGNHVHFAGLDSESNTEGYPSDIIFVNEALETLKEKVDGLKMRCRKLMIMDWNPKYTDHWCFDLEGQPNVFFTRTNYKNNKHLQKSIVTEIEGYEPWESGSYYIENNVVMYNGLPISDNNQPPVHRDNLDNKTIDEFRWKVYGLGLRGAMKGLIYPNVTWIDKFPDIAHTYGLDFGFTCFTGDTLVTTSKGDVPIELIKKGDLVLTRKGYRKVLNRFDNGVKKVITKEIGLDFGYKEINATFNHNFNVNDKWKRFGELTKKDRLVILSSSTEKNTEDTQKENTQTTTLKSTLKMGSILVKGYMSRFTSSIMAIFRKVIMSIIQIITLLITNPLIWLSYLLVNTQKSIILLINLIRQKKEKSTETRSGIVKRIGMNAGQSLVKNLKTKLGLVNHAQLNTHQQTHIKSFVIKNAITGGNTNQNLITLRESAKVAIKNLWATSTLNQKHAVQNVQMRSLSIIDVKTKSESYQRVYDLHVEDVHEYFANGILVHNCDPSALVKYAVSGRNIYVQLLWYAPTETSEEMHNVLKYCKVSKNTPITADSSDKFTSERKGSVQMVRELFARGWEIAKVSKTKGVMFWITDTKNYTIHIVKDLSTDHGSKMYRAAKKEQENYRMKEINGIEINQAEDKHDHFWNAMRYVHMAHRQEL